MYVNRGHALFCCVIACRVWHGFKNNSSRLSDFRVFITTYIFIHFTYIFKSIVLIFYNGGFWEKLLKKKLFFSYRFKHLVNFCYVTAHPPTIALLLEMWLKNDHYLVLINYIFSWDTLNFAFGNHGTETNQNMAG